jgi:hypothetical protein
MLPPLSIALGVGEQLELRWVNVYYTDTRSMSAVDERKRVSVILLWCFNLAMRVV